MGNNNIRECFYIGKEGEYITGDGVTIVFEFACTNSFYRAFRKKVLPFLGNGRRQLTNSQIEELVSNICPVILSELPETDGKNPQYFKPVRFSQTRRGPFYLVIPKPQPWRLVSIITKEQFKVYGLS